MRQKYMFVNVIMYANQGLLNEDIQYSMLEHNAFQPVVDQFSEKKVKMRCCWHI